MDILNCLLVGCYLRYSVVYREVWSPAKPQINKKGETYLAPTLRMYVGSCWQPRSDGTFGSLLTDKETSLEFYYNSLPKVDCY